jgi:hypothetical protein
VGRWLLGALVTGLAVVPAPAQAEARTDGSVPAPAHIVRLVTHVPASALNKVGAGDVLGAQQFGVFKLQGRLMSHGKPEVVTMNRAWCPHCAANNWALAVALSRFGTLSGLRVINTGTYYCKIAHDPCALVPFPCYPYTHGLSFFGSRLQSPYLSFGEVVLEDVRGHRLQRPTRRETAAFNQFDRFGGTPAVDVGGAYGFLNAGYSPGALTRKTWSQIAESLANPQNRIARRIDGLANLFSAAICKVTKGRPGAVCNSKGVLAAAGAHLH